MERKFGGKLLFQVTTIIIVVGLACYVILERHSRPWHGIAFVVAVILSILWGLLKVNRLLRQAQQRLSQARKAAERIAEGHFDRLPLDGDDELMGIATAFNAMSDTIQRREDSLRDESLALTIVNQRMEAVLDATNDGLALLNRDGIFVHVNRRFCEMMGTRKDVLLLENAEAIRPLMVQRFADPSRMMQALAPIEGNTVSDTFGLKEDVIELAREHVFLQVYTAPVRGDNREVSGRIVALHDITREKELDKMKTEFISVVSHELRTPLTSIKGYTDLMISGQTGEINEIQQEFLGIVQSSANRLGNLINDILDISRIEAGRLEMRQDPIDYGRILSDVLRLMKAVADEKDIIVDASFPETWPTVRGDSDKISQILTNLLSNSIKYTPAGGFVKVIIDTTASGTVTTCVADNGIGISVEDQKRLFQKFFRADNSLTREAGGTGLGLVIVKTMVEMLGGTIWVESETGKGSKFYFTLPIYETAVPTADTESGDAVDVEKAPEPLDRGLGLVLVVDDDSYARELIQHTLHRRGYGVVTASDWEESVGKARQYRPNVVLLDMMLPHMGGFRVLRSMHADPSMSRLPVIAYSLAGDPSMGQMTLGAFSFARKPLEYPALADRLKSYVGDDKIPVLLLVVCDAPADDADTAGVQELMELEGVRCVVATTTSEAIVHVVTDQVDAVLIDIDYGDEDMLFDLMRALKSEEDVARLPLILMTRDLAKNGLHFHLGGDNADHSASLEYLAEQVSRVMRG